MIIRAFAEVFRHPAYVALALSVAALVAAFELLFGSFGFILASPGSTGSGLSFQLLLTRDLLLGAAARHGWWTVAGILISSSLLGIVVSFALYTWRHLRTRATGALTLAGGGTIAGFLGLTCLACGPLLLGSFFAAIGGTGLLLALPLHGAEFTLLAVGLLLVAIYALARVITAPRVCSF